jgi:hypothetical protein
MDAGEKSGGERTSVVLGISLVIVLLAGLVWTIATQRTHALDAEQLFGQWFEARELPMQLVPVEAQVLPRGDRVLCLERRQAAAEAPLVTPPAEPPKPDAPPFDWSKVPIGEARSAPREVLIAELPLKDAAADLKALFEGGQELGAIGSPCRGKAASASSSAGTWCGRASSPTTRSSASSRTAAPSATRCGST